jgi:hypothetical protein
MSYSSKTPATSWSGLMVHFAKTAFSTKKGKLLLSLWGSFLVWMMLLKEKKRVSNLPASSTTEILPDVAKKQSLTGLLQVLVPHLQVSQS